jgi:hypothetical protein
MTVNENVGPNFETETIMNSIVKIWEIIRLRVRVLNATGSEFYWWRKPEYPEKTTEQPQVRK